MIRDFNNWLQLLNEGLDEGQSSNFLSVTTKSRLKLDCIGFSSFYRSTLKYYLVGASNIIQRMGLVGVHWNSMEVIVIWLTQPNVAFMFHPSYVIIGKPSLDAASTFEVRLSIT